MFSFGLTSIPRTYIILREIRLNARPEYSLCEQVMTNKECVMYTSQLTVLVLIVVIDLSHLLFNLKEVHYTQHI